MNSEMQEEAQAGQTTNTRLIALLDKIQDQQCQSYTLQREELNLKKRKTWLYAVIFGLPMMIYVLSTFGVIRDQLFNGEAYAALIRIQGPIMPETAASATTIVPAIERACEDDKAKSLLIKINSPGGSPVQSDQIYDAINHCREKTGKQIIAVGEDMMTSGAYWIASAADKIFANASSLTGSIGVKMEGFGVDLSQYLANYGLERRVQTAGQNKNRSDMFLPLTEQDSAKTQTILSELHENFKQAVLKGRKDIITSDHKLAFSGDYWTGSRALALGLIDDVKDMSQVMQDVLQVEHLLDYSPRPSIMDSLKNSMRVETLMDDVFQYFSENHPRYVAM